MVVRRLGSALIATLAFSAILAPTAVQADVPDVEATPELTYVLEVVETDMVTGAVVTYEVSDLASTNDVSTATAGAANCKAGGKSISGVLRAYDDDDLVYKLHSSFDFYYNCVSVWQVANFNGYFSDMHKGWESKGVDKVKQGVGTAHATTLVSGHAARYCTPWGCVNHSYPFIKYDLYATGGYVGKGGGS